MSTTDEKYRAIARAGFYLEACMNRKQFTEKERVQARMILRHFPALLELEEIFNGREKDRVPKGMWKHMTTERDFEREKMRGDKK